jgi:ArsR family transcriptional regulator
MKGSFTTSSGRVRVCSFTPGYQISRQYIQKKEYDCAMDDSSCQHQAQIFRALMHPSRLAILELLRDGEVCVCHLTAALNCRQAYISQQLAVLREAGLVDDRREGWNVYYWVAEPRVYALIDTVRGMIGDIMTREPMPHKLPGCTCPTCATSEEVLGKQAFC